MARRGEEYMSGVPLTDSGSAEIKTAEEPVWLDIRNQEHIATAVGHLVSGDAPLFLPFGNIIGAFSHPSEQAVGDLNELKGRDRDKTGSVTTIPAYYEGLANWDNLDGVLTKGKVLKTMEHLNGWGPIGFLLPAADDIPRHLSKVMDANGRLVKTVQLIVPGSESPVNEIFQRAVHQMPDTPYIFATSANVSSAVTKIEQAAHHRFDPLVDEFARAGKGGLIIVRDDESAMRRRHPYHDSRSTTILDLTGAIRDENGQVRLDNQRHPVIRVSRFGSAKAKLVQRVLAEQGLGVEFPDTKIPKLYYSRAERTLYAIRELTASVRPNPVRR